MSGVSVVGWLFALLAIAGINTARRFSGSAWLGGVAGILLLAAIVVVPWFGVPTPTIAGPESRPAKESNLPMKLRIVGADTKPLNRSILVSLAHLGYVPPQATDRVDRDDDPNTNAANGNLEADDPNTRDANANASADAHTESPASPFVYRNWHTDNDGRVTLDGLPAGRHWLIADPHWLHATSFSIDAGERPFETRRLNPALPWHNRPEGVAPEVRVEVHPGDPDDVIHVTLTNPANQPFVVEPLHLNLTSADGFRAFLPPDQMPKPQTIPAAGKHEYWFNWTKIVERGIWIQRGEPIDEPWPPLAESEEGRQFFRFNFGASGPVVQLTRPETIIGRRALRKRATARLEFDRPEYFLGENVLAHFGVVNRADQPLAVEFGGDYRGGQRHARIKVAVTDDEGRPVADPYPSQMNMGGIGGFRSLEPGGTFWITVPLNRYALFSRPGTYRLRVYHDLGWDDDRGGAGSEFPSKEAAAGKLLAPIAEGTITLKMPTEAEARDAIERALKLPSGTWTTGSGEKSEPFADFTTLRQPIYAPLLADLAQRAGLRPKPDEGSMPQPHPAIIGLSSIADPAATRVLLKLLESDDARLVGESLDQLLRRLPYPHLKSKTPQQFGFGADDAIRLADGSWRDEFRKPLRQWAWNVWVYGKPAKDNLGDDVRANRLRAARMMQAIGTREDYRDFAMQMGWLLEYRDDPTEQDSYPRPQTLHAEVASALWNMFHDGRIDTPLDAEQIGAVVKKIGLQPDPYTFVRLLGQCEDYRPEDWKSRVANRLRDADSFLVAHTLDWMPADPSFDKWIESYIAGEDRTKPPVRLPGTPPIVNPIRSPIPVRIAAINAAHRSGRSGFAPAIRELLAKSDNQWIKGAAEFALADHHHPERHHEVEPESTKKTSPPASLNSPDRSPKKPRSDSPNPGETPSPPGDARDSGSPSRESIAEALEPDDWFWTDPYPHLGHDDAKGPGWQFVRIAADESAGRDFGATETQHKALAEIYRLFSEGGPEKVKPTDANIVHLWNKSRYVAASLLTADQIRRIEQLMIQRVSYNAFRDEQLAAQLELTDKQRAAITAAIDRHLERIRANEAQLGRDTQTATQSLTGEALAQRVRELTSEKVRLGILSHRQVWTDIRDLLQPAQRDQFRTLRGPRPANEA